MPQIEPIQRSAKDPQAAIQTLRIATERLVGEARADEHRPLSSGAELSGIVRDISVDDVHCDLLIRDAPADDPLEFASLCDSIRALGLLTPIQVVAREDGSGYELVQGGRRLRACRALHMHDPSGGFERIAAIVLPPRQDKDALYRRMVDDNACRRSLSYTDMAFAAANFAADRDTSPLDLNAAIAALFQSANRTKRDHIRTFARLLARVGSSLKYPAELPRDLGLQLAARLDLYPPLADELRTRLKDWDNRSIADELGVICALVNEPLARPV